ncbi:LytTR family DNA-binding domain-containing protein [Niallia taxi]|uniref:LytR/AlgR family response regulator transcription factor n=1 Tax=Niallia TaxID=2837506 RepID=UPI0030F6013F
MLNIAICDDVFEVTSQTEVLIKRYNPNFSVDVFYNATKLIEILPKSNYHLFILDIEFPESSGLEIASRIREFDVNVPIVFVTSYDNYAMEVFKLHTFDFILKPLTEQELFPVLDKVIKYLNFEEKHFVFQYNKVDYSLPLQEIVYFEKRMRKVLIHTIDEEHSVMMTTRELISNLDDTFVRVHNSYIINIRFVREIRNDYLTLNMEKGSDIWVPISKNYKTTARKSILLKLREKIR